MGVSGMPLASELRPNEWNELVGQQHLVGPRGVLTPIITRGQIPTQSIILHGPPGTGKTTIARLLASRAKFVEISALSAGVATLREEIEAAEKRLSSFDQRTVLFVDEIHRFAKNQQEALLAAVESGLITLIGATTEYPGTNIVRALLSRCLVFELYPLDDLAISEICIRAVKSGLLSGVSEITEDALTAAVRHASGDARRALNLIQAAAAQLPLGVKVIDGDAIERTGVERVLDFDRDGSYHYDTISAFIKSVRGSDVDAALGYLAVMLTGGERPEFIGRRLMILAAEDIGLADPQALPLAVAANAVATQVGMPEARIPLAEATIYLALAPKSNSAYLAIDKAIKMVSSSGPISIPGHLKSQGTSSYRYPHDFNPPIIRQAYWLSSHRFYEPTRQGSEGALDARHRQIRSILGDQVD